MDHLTVEIHPMGRDQSNKLKGPTSSGYNYCNGPFAWAPWNYEAT